MKTAEHVGLVRTSIIEIHDPGTAKSNGIVKYTPHYSAHSLLSNRNICVTRMSSPANGANITDVLLSSLI